MKMKKFVATLLMVVMLCQSTNCLIFAKEITSNAINMQENHEEIATGQAVEVTENQELIFKTNDGLNIAIPAGLYFIPLIGEVLIEATGAIIIAGAAIAVGSEMYNRVVKWLGEFLAKPSDKIDWDEIYGVFYRDFHSFGADEDNKTREENKAIVLPILKQTVDEPNFSTGWGGFSGTDKCVNAYCKLFPDEKVMVTVETIFENGKISVNQAEPDNACGPTWGRFYMHRIFDWEPDGINRQSLMERFKETEWRWVVSKLKGCVAGWDTWTCFHGPTNMHQFVKYLPDENSAMTVRIFEGYDRKLSLSDAWCDKLINYINWNDCDKNHIMKGSGEGHVEGFKKLGFDPKEPKNWDKLLAFLKITVDNFNSASDWEDVPNGQIIYYTKQFADKGVTIVVKLFKDTAGKIRLSDAWPKW